MILLLDFLMAFVWLVGVGMLCMCVYLQKSCTYYIRPAFCCSRPYVALVAFATNKIVYRPDDVSHAAPDT